ncbi:hypothetical protein AVEN_165450-1 [Araneus ventricosus]|uniref:RNA-directed DNA polymerase n=1 Tax=Araneus ventricosus TaxID=182803 RepID=A0A4Y2HWT6_ARAVE|nr:hypothetical protein AVEN_165450-1 [Araneus ventricosus]
MLDMKTAFNQIPSKKSDRKKTAFSSLEGTKWEFNRLCFELKNSPKAFQAISQEVLGCILTPQGLQIDKDKTVEVNEFKTPENESDVKSSLGLAGFYRRYIRNFSKRAAPLSNLLRKDATFDWNEEAQKAFNDIKNASLLPPAGDSHAHSASWKTCDFYGGER